MLYVSRSFHDGSCGVVDTDDDVETRVSWQELNETVAELGLDIKGVTVQSVTDDSKIVADIEPYQDSRYYTRLQLKTKTLLGVEVKTWRDEITFIRANNSVVKRDTFLRLSSFGSTMSGMCEIVWSYPYWSNGNILTLALDEHIKIVDKPLAVGVQGVRWDISDVENEELVRQILTSFQRTGLGIKMWDVFFLDRQERIKKWLVR